MNCDQCGTKYFYELSRIGSGDATAPYAIGTARAERSAKVKAQRDLDRRLDEEAELVPCPKCLWINDHLVSGFRRASNRGVIKFAAGIGLAGTLLTVVTAWCSTAGAGGADRGTVISILTVGLGTSLGIPVFILVVSNFLRTRIQPNRGYPLSPKLPPGTPIALVRNRATGDLEPAGQVPKPSAGGDGAWMDFQIGRTSLPPICCDCLAPDSPRFGCRFPLAVTVELIVPLCKTCARRWSRRKWLCAMVALGAAAAVVIPIMLALKFDEIAFWFTVFVLGTLLPIIGAMIAGRRAAPVRVENVELSRGVARLWFRNENYLNDVVAKSSSSIVHGVSAHGSGD